MGRDVNWVIVGDHSATDEYVKENFIQSHRHPLYQALFNKPVGDQPDELLLVGRETVGRQQGQGGQRGIADTQQAVPSCCR
jgi:hypothetical protein